MPDPKPDKNRASDQDRAADALDALAQAASGAPIASSATQHPPNQAREDVAPSTSAPRGAGGPSMQQRRAVQARAARDQAHRLKRTLIPPMLVMALLLFGIGGWAVLALCGYDFLTDEASPAVERLAKIMLLCWPVGILTVLGVWLFQRDVKRGERRDR